jgi:SSS family solute:Na+ symporter
MNSTFNLAWIDYAIMFVYFAFVLGIGWVLKSHMKGAKAFLEAGKSMPAWVAGIAFMSTNLGALAMMGMIGSAAKYGMLTFHFFWIGAIPAMVFLGVFMMPFYYGSKARSVPEFLKLRYDEKTRGLNAILFGVMTILTSGISMYATAILAERVLGWNFHFALLASAAIVLIYTYMGGLSSAIYNEVLQFFIVVAGLLPLVIISLIDVGGWHALKTNLAPIVTSIPGKAYAPDVWTSTWKYTGSAAANPMGVEWYSILLGLGIFLSFGYWCTDFLIVQRAMAAKSKHAAQNTPLIAAMPQMFVPFLIIPGIVALWLMHMPQKSFSIVENGVTNYDLTIIMLLKYYLPSGVLGLGLTALMASFMSGMAGNISAFNTVWTYDIYQSYIRPRTGDGKKDDVHYMKVGRITTIIGVIAGIGAAYIAKEFHNVTDLLQTIFSMVNAPLFGVILLGMFWKRCSSNGAFLGLAFGISMAALHHGMTEPLGSTTLYKGGWLHVVHVYPVEMAQNLWTAIISFSSSTLSAVAISLLSKNKKTDSEMVGLVYQLTPKEKFEGVIWYKKSNVLAVIVLVMLVVLSILFW